MLFNSFEFAIFLAVVLCVYPLLRTSGQNVWLLCASYTFYGLWDWRFLSLIAFSTTVDYFIAQRMHRVDNRLGLKLGTLIHPEQRKDQKLNSKEELAKDTSDADTRRKRLLYVSLICNLGLLGIFKYFNFFVDSFVALGAQVGLNLDTPALRLLPPVGISFYTFQSMAYSIDVYRRQLKPENNFITFALFVSYFPQLVAGPIERASRLLPQIQKQRHVTVDCLRSGLVLILIGLFKKVVIADNAGVEVNRIFSDIQTQSSATLLSGGILFTLQIYGDFSGYSNMARGMSRLLGIHLVENFKTPYLSSSISEFWRRWHVSLSEWLRDYLYIPLGGNRDGSLRTRRNLMLTMLLGGLWHGAAWTFVIWGLFHGAFLGIHQWWQAMTSSHITSTSRKNKTYLRIIRWLLAVGLTYTCVMMTFIVFRANSLEDAIAYIQGMVSLRGSVNFRDYLLIGLLGALLAPLELIQYTNQDRLLAVRALALPVRSLVYALMVLALLLASSVDIPFIYFQF